MARSHSKAAFTSYFIMKNAGKYALITGGTSGIGLELAKLFAQDHYNVIIVARNQQELNSTAELLRPYGVEVITMAKDLFQRNAAYEIYSELQERNIQIDVLVNDAGQGQHGLFVDNDLEREIDIIQLNVISLVALTKFYLKDMVARGEGKILNLASIASEVPGPWQAVYHATKAFVLSFSEAIQNETKDTGVTITALQPDVTDTDFFNKADMNDARAVQDESNKADPAKVAKDGYDALMAGKVKIISGLKNKVQVTMSNMMPDTKATDNMRKQNEPVETEKK